MATECIQKSFAFHPLRNRQIRAQFDGGAITTEGGGLLLREVEKRIGIVRQFAACFRDFLYKIMEESPVIRAQSQNVSSASRRTEGMCAGRADDRKRLLV